MEYDENTKQALREQTMDIVIDYLDSKEISAELSDRLFDWHNAKNVNKLAGSITESIINVLGYEFVDKHMPVVRRRLDYMLDANHIDEYGFFDSLLDLRTRLISADYIID